MSVNKAPAPLRDLAPASQPISQPLHSPQHPAHPHIQTQTGLRYPNNGKTIYQRPLNRTRTAESSQAAFAYLFSEMVGYAQRRVTGIQDLEKR